jgi:uncharacterized protein (TIGR02266 family)
MSYENKRAHPRVDADFEVKFETVDQFALAYAMEVSLGGMFLATPDPLPQGAELRVRLVLPETLTEISTRARVRHARTVAQADSGGLPPGMGLQFLDLDAAMLARLEHFVAERMAAQEEDSPAPAAVEREGISGLVVDDDPQYQRMLGEAFTNPGDTVRFAANGFEALALCGRETPDIIVSDVNMPKMDGWQLLRLLRAKPQFAAVPFVFATTLRGEADRLRGYKLGVDDYIAKPFRVAEVRARVDRLLARYRARAEAQARAQRSPPPPSGAGHSLRGDLAHVSLASILGLMEMEQRTGRLSLYAVQTGIVRLRRGECVHATVGNPAALRDREALLEMLGWRTGDFDFVACDVPDEDTVGLPLSHMILEHARISDEGHR